MCGFPISLIFIGGSNDLERRDPKVSPLRRDTVHPDRDHQFRSDGDGEAAIVDRVLTASLPVPASSERAVHVLPAVRDDAA